VSVGVADQALAMPLDVGGLLLYHGVGGGEQTVSVAFELLDAPIEFESDRCGRVSLFAGGDPFGSTSSVRLGRSVALLRRPPKLLGHRGGTLLEPAGACVELDHLRPPRAQWANPPERRLLLPREVERQSFQCGIRKIGDLGYPR